MSCWWGLGGLGVEDCWGRHSMVSLGPSTVPSAAQLQVDAQPLPITGHLCLSPSCLLLPGPRIIWGHVPGASPARGFSWILAFLSVTLEHLESL